MMPLAGVISRHRTPSTITFGNTATPTGSSGNSQNRAWLTKFTMPSAGTITKLSIRTSLSGSSTGSNCKALIYADSSGVASTRLGVGTAVAVPGNNVTFDAPISVHLTAGTYWFGHVGDNFQGAFGATSNGFGSQTQALSTNVNYTSPGSAWPGNDATYDTLGTLTGTYIPD